MYGAAGCEFPQLIYIGHDYYTGDQSFEVPNALDFTVAHEVVHQWFYGLVGNNQYQHAFIDEGLTQYLSAQIYFGMTYNDDAGDLVMESFIERPFERFTRAGDDWIVDTPTDEFPSSSAYGWSAYSKAPMGFAAIFDEIGEDAFFAALQDYVAEFTFLVARPPDLLEAFEDASGEDLGDLWTHWFEETNGADDVDSYGAARGRGRAVISVIAFLQCFLRCKNPKSPKCPERRRFFLRRVRAGSPAMPVKRGRAGGPGSPRRSPGGHLPRAYSVDLRERSLQAMASGRSVTEVASLFDVSRSSLHRWRRQMVLTQSLAPGRSPGRHRRLTADQEQAIAVQVRATPDATLDELCAASPVPVSRATMGRTVQRLGLRRKKRP